MISLECFCDIGANLGKNKIKLLGLCQGFEFWSSLLFIGKSSYVLDSIVNNEGFQISSMPNF